MHRVTQPMSWSPAPSTPTESKKPSFFSEIEPISSLNLAEFSNEDSQFLEPPPSPKVGKRGKCLVAMSTTITKQNSSSQACFEMDYGVIVDTKSILRKMLLPDEASTSTPVRKCIKWRDEAPEGSLTTLHLIPDSNQKNIRTVNKKYGEGSKTKIPASAQKNGDVTDASLLTDTPNGTERRFRTDKLDISCDDSGVPLVEYPNGEGDDDSIPLSPKAPKRKYQRKKKAEIEVDARMEDDAPHILNDDDSEIDAALMIDDIDENAQVLGEKKGKPKRKTALELRNEKEAMIILEQETLAKWNAKTVKTEQEEDEEFDEILKLATMAVKKKERVVKVKSREELVKELELQISGLDTNNGMVDIHKMEKVVFDSWSQSLKDDLGTETEEEEIVLRPNYDSDEELEKERRLNSRSDNLEDMPDLDDVLEAYNRSKLEEEGIAERKKREEEEAMYREKREAEKKAEVEPKKVFKKKNGKKGGIIKKKKKKEIVVVPDRPLTDEEKTALVLAEIERKKMDAEEKAMRMKQFKMEQKVERECKKEAMEKQKEAKRIMKNDKRSIIDRKPRSRAEAARRTKRLLAMEEESEQSDAEEENGEEDEPKRKKRKYKKRTKPISFFRRSKDADDEDSEVGCGKYIENPCDVCYDEEWTNVPYEDEGEEDEEEEIDEVLSVPFLWTSEEDKLAEGAIGPQNFDSDEHMKRHLNDIEQYSEGLNEEYREMVKKLDGMKLNLFADTTLRRFDHRVVHNIDSLSTVRTWPIDMLPRLNFSIPIYQNQIWNKPFEGLVRVRPIHKKKDQTTSKEIDMMSGGAVKAVTKNDVMLNLEELIASKLKKTTKWMPLPSARNPFDIPEVSTRNASHGANDYQSVSYVQKNHVKSMPCEFTNKKRKKTRKEVLKEIATKPKPSEELNKGIYKEDEEGEVNEEEAKEEDKDGYTYAWNEMGEMIGNPMKDDQVVEVEPEVDPFYGDQPAPIADVYTYEGMEYMDNGVDEESGMMEEGYYNDDMEEEEETHLGEAISIMTSLEC